MFTEHVCIQTFASEVERNSILIQIIAVGKRGAGIALLFVTTA